MGQLPYVLTPQWFGSLVFERRTVRYLPFDHEATALLRALVEVPPEVAFDGLGEEAWAFYEAFEERGFFRLDGRFAAEVLELKPPQGHLAGPLAVHLEIIGACNLTCSHCFAAPLPRHHHPLRVEEMVPLFAELSAIGSFRLGLTGGEPLMRHDLLDILDAALEAGLRPCITTNATLLTERLARELGKRPLVWLNVSLDGPDAATNDAVRGAGTFDAVVAKLPLLRRHARFALAFTLMRCNAHLAKECVRLAEEVGAGTAVFRPLYPAGAALHDLSMMPTFTQYRQALEELAGVECSLGEARIVEPFGPEQRRPTEATVHTAPTCGAGQHVCSISVQGDVSPCSFLGPGFVTGNVRERPFREIWNEGEAMRLMRQKDDFTGGCRARSQALAGSAHAADPWMVEYIGGAPLHPGANVEISRAVPLPLV
jgi:radical SAM protein with 4Fe4S-binding SPASM domain